jgi:hypothetical protein
VALFRAVVIICHQRERVLLWAFEIDNARKGPASAEECMAAPEETANKQAAPSQHSEHAARHLISVLHCWFVLALCMNGRPV